MDGNKFQIENGMILQGYPKENRNRAAFEWPDGDVRRFEEELFVENAHYLFENREKIFADSRMFLAPVNVMSGMAYCGTLCKPTLGTYIEWWLRRGKEELAYFVNGSPLSGANVSLSIAKNGKLVPLPSPGKFIDLAKEYDGVHRRYIEERERFEAYTLWEVIRRLKGEAPQYHDSYKASLLERVKERLEKKVDELTENIKELKRRVQSYKDKLKNAQKSAADK